MNDVGAGLYLLYFYEKIFTLTCGLDYGLTSSDP